MNEWSNTSTASYIFIVWYLMSEYIFLGSRDRVVCVLTRLGSGRSEDLIPGGIICFFSFPKCSDIFWCPLSLLLNWYLGSFQGVKWSQCEVDHSPPSSAKIKNGVVTLLHLCVFMAYLLFLCRLEHYLSNWWGVWEQSPWEDIGKTELTESCKMYMMKIG
jgi:hypothetical protein